MPPPETMKVLKPLLAQDSRAARPAAGRCICLNRRPNFGCFAVANHACAIASNSSSVMPAWVAKASSKTACLPSAMQGLHVVFEQGLVGLALLQRRVLRRQAPSPGRSGRTAAPGSAARTTACRRCRRSRCARPAARSPARLPSSRARRNRGSRTSPRRRSRREGVRPRMSPSFRKVAGGGLLRRPLPLRSVAAATRRVFHRLDRVIDAEGVRLLDDREVLERLRELLSDRHRAVQDVGVIEQPLVVLVRRDVRELVGVRSQIEELGQPQLDERLRPHAHRSLACAAP